MKTVKYNIKYGFHYYEEEFYFFLRKIKHNFIYEIIKLKRQIKKLWKDLLTDLDLIETYFLRKYILKCADQIFKELNLEPIKINFPSNFHNCSCERNSYNIYNLTFGIPALSWNNDILSKTIFNHIKGNFKTKKQKWFFIVAHEIAHYLQFQKFNNWAENNYKQSRIMSILGLNHKEYRQLNIERKADKIALIMCKRFKIIVD